MRPVQTLYILGHRELKENALGDIDLLHLGTDGLCERRLFLILEDCLPGEDWVLQVGFLEQRSILQINHLQALQ